MKVIRRGVFETNSSSTHSICITKSNIYELPNRVYFKFGEFGQREDKLDTLEEKASYLYTAIVEIEGYINQKYRNYMIEQIFTWMAEDNIECEFERPKDDGSFFKCGYVDHSGELKDFIKAITNNKKRLYRYLFSDESFVLTGNDNDDTDIEIYVDYKHEEYYKGN